MKNKLTVIISILLVCLTVFTITGCVGTSGGLRCAYFTNLEDAVSALSSQNTEEYSDISISDYAHLALPKDERFVDAEYIFMNFRNLAGVKSQGKIHDDMVFVVYKALIDGEDVFVIHYYTKRFKESLGDSSVPYIEASGRGWLDYALEIMAPTERNLVFYKNRQEKPNGYIEQFINFENTEAAIEWIDKNCSSFVLNGSSGYNCAARWSIYDTRNVPQAEKEALASELMEILYNNYKMAGEKAE